MGWGGGWWAPIRRVLSQTRRGLLPRHLERANNNFNDNENNDDDNDERRRRRRQRRRQQRRPQAALCPPRRGATLTRKLTATLLNSFTASSLLARLSCFSIIGRIWANSFELRLVQKCNVCLYSHGFPICCIHIVFLSQTYFPSLKHAGEEKKLHRFLITCPGSSFALWQLLIGNS